MKRKNRMQDLSKLYLPIVITAALVSGCGDKTDETTAAEKSPSQVAAKVNGSELTVHQVNYALQRVPNLQKDQAETASLQVVRNLVDQEVLVQKALAEKMDRDTNVVQALEAARRQILAEAYMSRKLGTPAQPSEADIVDYYEKHPDLFAKRKVYRLQEIAIKAPQDKRDAIRAKLDASKDLNEFAAWLKAENHPVKAGEAVKAAEQLPLEMLPKIAQMPAGQAMVANAPDGMLVIVVAGSQAQPVTLEQAKPAIERLLQAQARQKAAKSELDSLKAAAKIEYVGEFADAGKEVAALAAPAASAAAKTDSAGRGESDSAQK
jgi:EpsD family peptidyl-prolyl cis-trans isomerase